MLFRSERVAVPDARCVLLLLPLVWTLADVVWSQRGGSSRSSSSECSLFCRPSLRNTFSFRLRPFCILSLDSFFPSCTSHLPQGIYTLFVSLLGKEVEEARWLRFALLFSSRLRTPLRLVDPLARFSPDPPKQADQRPEASPVKS